MTDGRTDYATLGMALDELRSAMTVSELHGGLCGTLCSGGARTATAWLEACIREAASTVNAAEQARDVFRAVELETWRALASADLDFTPLLPEDDLPLDDRVNELGLWCHGFLSGLALGGVTFSTDDSRAADNTEGDSPLEEIVKDFAAISRAGLSTGEHSDPTDADFALAEIIEYVRVGTQIIFEEIGATRGSENSPPALMSEH